MTTPEGRHEKFDDVERLRQEILLLLSRDKDRLDGLRDADQKAVTAALAAAEKAVGAALAAAEKAVTKAEDNAEKWRTNANEWRGAMNDREADFIRKQQYISDIVNIQSNIKDLKEGSDINKGSGIGLHQGWGYLVGGIGLAVLLVELFLRLKGV
jgi:hypothetical protein